MDSAIGGYYHVEWRLNREFIMVYKKSLVIL